MTAASLIAFGMVFLGASLAASLLFGGSLLLARSQLRALGPWAERRAAAMALILPPALGVGLTVALAADSALSIRAGTDHCLAHDHHLHLCLKHGAEWASQPWAMAAVAFAVALVVVRAGQALWAHCGAQRGAVCLARLGEVLDDAGRCYLVPSDERFVFTAGLFAPRVIISRGAWTSLGSEERQAVLAHEIGHVVHGDLWRRALLGIAARFGLPYLVHRALRLWDISAERACDRRAAAMVGRPSVVASSIVTLARGTAARSAPAGAVFAAACSVSDRVQSLLGDEPEGLGTASRLSRVLALSSLGVAALFAVFAEPLHHLLETILG